MEKTQLFEKLKEAISDNYGWDGRLNKADVAHSCEAITRDYAKGLIEWLSDNYIQSISGAWHKRNISISFGIKSTVSVDESFFTTDQLLPKYDDHLKTLEK